MKLKRTILGPILVVLVAFVSGGWLLQRGVAAERGAFQSARILEEVLQRVSRDFIDPHPADELYQMAVEGLLKELGDPHTAFMSAEEYNNLRVQTTGEYGGLGIQIAERDGWITVMTPLPNTPAERAGVQAGDRIIEVEGRSTEGWSEDQAVRELRGPRGTPVTLRVARIGVDEPIPFTIVREEIHVNSVNAAYMVEPGIGYAELTVFSETTTQDLSRAINELRQQGMRGLILDLRRNPGGLLDQGISVSDLFLDRGTSIVETRARNPRDNITFRARAPEIFADLPIVVLVGEFSASAAEIVAGALQDHDRGLVVGAPTFGKGSVQTLFPLSGGNFLKMTTGRWYTPAGRSIQVERQREGDPVALVENQPVDDAGVPVTRDLEADTINRRQYRTTGGRLVYGGGGIVPDLLVRPDTLTALEREFLRTAARQGTTYSSVVYRYAVDFARENESLGRDFEITPAMRAEFHRRLVEGGIEVTREQVEDARRIVERDLGFQIAQYKFGRPAAEQRANRTDNLIRTASELLGTAATQETLFQVAQTRAQASR